ncbi:metal-dependent transcriptional regulator [Treponema sp. OMZ 840]|uniref:metal-dependent transcriptional regulator n=1 Tax=Treponema sp. OMZ 840 TaxID=244313 RepID=UPI003D8D3089
MTQSLEDYLETIGNLAQDGNIPRVKDIAATLKLSKPSVHVALHLLEDRGMIEHEPYGDIIITELGKQKYLEIKHKHDTISSFLRNNLGVSSENAEKDACLMEHILSDETLEKIEKCVQTAGINTCALCSEVAVSHKSGTAKKKKTN